MSRSSNKKKAQGMYVMDRRPDLERVVRDAKKKSWPEVTSMDLYYLFDAGLKTTDIQQFFRVTSTQVINRLRRT